MSVHRNGAVVGEGLRRPFVIVPILIDRKTTYVGDWLRLTGKSQPRAHSRSDQPVHAAARATSVGLPLSGKRRYAFFVTLLPPGFPVRDRTLPRLAPRGRVRPSRAHQGRSSPTPERFFETRARSRRLQVEFVNGRDPESVARSLLTVNCKRSRWWVVVGRQATMVNTLKGSEASRRSRSAKVTAGLAHDHGPRDASPAAVRRAAAGCGQPGMLEFICPK